MKAYDVYCPSCGGHPSTGVPHGNAYLASCDGCYDGAPDSDRIAHVTGTGGSHEDAIADWLVCMTLACVERGFDND